MVILHILLIGLFSKTETKEPLTKSLGDTFIPFTQTTLNQARFLRLQQTQWRRLPARQERRKPTGAPVLVCGEGVMGIVMRYPFDGRIFASHREKDPECLQYVTKKTLPKFLTSLRGQCGVRSKQSTMPSTTDFHLRIVVSYGYEYLTEEDKIYDLTCSYSSENISVNAHYDAINFVAMPLKNYSSPPICHYSLRLNTLDGPQIHSTVIGELVYHRWSCPSKEFAFKVYRCYIHNGIHQSYLIIDDKGCSLDEDILPHPTYDAAQDLVYTASKAFRFTKSRRVLFTCMIAICHQSDYECMREIPPRCPRAIRKRHLSAEMLTEERLEHLHMLVGIANNTSNEEPLEYAPLVNDHYISFRRRASTPMTEASSFITDGSFVPTCESSNNSQWIIILLTTNLLSVLLIIRLCAADVRHRHCVDVTDVCSHHLSLY
ncbi:ZP domain-containing protein [Trichostrongylus colubriformis]|uniref:ZP domain-containing protein n=1 Tax=Trichostrongylus colubriformis TaxID=6319 RepID=A0AAN8F5S5_TRICO